MSKETFVVGCEGIGFHGGVVMLDLAGFSDTQKDAEGRPLREHRVRLILTPEGMLETARAMQGMIGRLVEVGLLKRTEAAPAAAGTEGVSPVTPSSGNGQPKSPNF